MGQRRRPRRGDWDRGLPVAHHAVAVEESIPRGSAGVSAPPTGYSGTPLGNSLGLREALIVLTIDAPRNYRSLLSGMPKGVRFVTETEPPIAFAHLFASSAALLAEHLARLKAALAPNGLIWASWPKESSRVATDIPEHTIREAALPMGLVDVKVCAVDVTWSGLKLVIR